MRIAFEELNLPTLSIFILSKSLATLKVCAQHFHMLLASVMLFTAHQQSRNINVIDQTAYLAIINGV